MKSNKTSSTTSFVVFSRTLKPTPVWHAARQVGSWRLYSADTMRSVSREQNDFSKPTNGVLFAWVVGKHVCNVMQPLLQRVEREVENTALGGTILYQRCYRTWKLSWFCPSLFSQEIKANRSVSLFLICWLTCLYQTLAICGPSLWISCKLRQFCNLAKTSNTL